MKAEEGPTSGGADDAGAARGPDEAPPGERADGGEAGPAPAPSASGPGAADVPSDPAVNTPAWPRGLPDEGDATLARPTDAAAAGDVGPGGWPPVDGGPLDLEAEPAAPEGPGLGRARLVARVAAATLRADPDLPCVAAAVGLAVGTLPGALGPGAPLAVRAAVDDPRAAGVVACALALAGARRALASAPPGLEGAPLEPGWARLGRGLAAVVALAPFVLARAAAGAAAGGEPVAPAALAGEAWLLTGLVGLATLLVGADGAASRALGWVAGAALVVLPAEAPGGGHGPLAAWAQGGASAWAWGGLGLLLGLARLLAPASPALVEVARDAEARELGLLRRQNARLGALFALVLAAAALGRQGGEARAATAAPADVVGWRSTHVEARLPAALLEPGARLLEGADALVLAARAALDVEAPPAGAPPLAVELVGPSAPLVEVALPPPAAAPGVPARVVADAGARLGLARAVARRARPPRPGPGLLLGEGLCLSAAGRAAGEDGFWWRFAVAVAHARRPLGPHEHLDAERLARTRGAELGPALGEVWVEALRRAGGPAAPLRALEVLEGAGAAARPADLWARALAAAGVSDADATEAALALIEDEVRLDRRAEVPLPRLLVIEEDQAGPMLRVLAIPDGPIPPDWEVVCRLAPGEEGGPTTVVRLGRDRSDCHAFGVPVDLFAAMGPRPLVQVGFAPFARPPGWTPLWEEWTRLSVPR